jgi:hypothetical protein
VSFTVTVNWHEAVFPDVSVTVLVTVVVPFGNAEPEGGVLTSVLPGQLSLLVTTKLTTAEQRFGSVETVIFAGQVIVGGSLSLIVTVKVHDAVFFDSSLTSQVTVVTPFGKVAPEAGMHVTAPTPGQLSVAVGVV